MFVPRQEQTAGQTSLYRYSALPRLCTPLGTRLRIHDVKQALHPVVPIQLARVCQAAKLLLQGVQAQG